MEMLNGISIITVLLAPRTALAADMVAREIEYE